MAKKHKPTKFLNYKLIAKFLADYKKMPYKSKSAIMAAILVLLMIPLVLIYPLDPATQPLDIMPLTPVTPTTECYITGCASHLCLDTKIEAPITICDYRPEYACLQHALCEVQKSGRCGWTETADYRQCLSTVDRKN